MLLYTEQSIRLLTCYNDTDHMYSELLGHIQNEYKPLFCVEMR